MLYRQRAGDAAAAREHADRAAEGAERAKAGAGTAAEAVGVRQDFEHALTEAGSPEEARAGVGKVSGRLAEAARHLRGMQQEVRQAEAEAERAADREQRQRERYDRACAEGAVCSQERRAAVDRYLSDASSWAESLVQLVLPDLDDLLARAESWSEALTPPPPVDEASQRAMDEGARRLERRRQEIDAERAVLREQDAELESEQARLTAGLDRAPACPPMREALARTQRPGAPLWRVCDFREHVAPEERAMLEAALEASGLLDAWIAPEGCLLQAADGDAIPTPEAPPCDDAHSLSRMLCVTLDPGDVQAAALGVGRIEAVLARIAVGAGGHHTFVTPDGRWKHNLLEGRWRKPAAEYIGAAAREQARRRRLEAIGEERAGLARREAVYIGELDAMAARDAALRAEFEARPAAQPVLAADQDSRRAQAAVAREREELLQHVEQLHACRSGLQEKRAAYQQTAADLHLAQWVDDLDALDGALASLTGTLGELWLALERDRHTRQRAEETARELTRVEERLSVHEKTHREAEADVTRRRREFETLRETAGQAAQEIKARLDGVQQGLTEAARTLDEARDSEHAVREACVRLEERRDAARQRLADVEAERAAEHEAFHCFVATRIVDEADLALESPPDPDRAAELAVYPAVEFARVVDRVLAVRWDEDTRDRVQNELLRRFQELQSALTAHEYSPMSETHHDITIVTCPYQGKPRSMRELGRCLDDEVTQRRQLLAAEERRFIENYLIGEVAHHLHRKIREADTLVANMNAELQARPMSSGMKLRFVWTPRTDGPAGLVEARRLLGQAQEILSPEDRDMLADFLQERIRQVREDGESGSWRDTLAEAVDYRQWHLFGVERQQAGRWTRLTRRTHGTGSGGEKAIALTIPQFAAAAAHYHNIPRAPRLIMLDEAFVGIDSDMRGKCMDLLHQFDLDFVMTSEREWGCYPTTRGLAIYQLATRPDIDAIAVTRWVWNGREKRRRDTPPPAQPTAAPGTASPEADLFAGAVA